MTEEDEEFKRIEMESGWRKRQIFKQEKLMKIEIEHMKDNDDGSCNVMLNTDNEANLFLIRYGLVAALTDAIAKAKEEYTPKEENPSQADIEYLTDLVDKQDKLLQDQAKLIERLQKVPLSDERIHALYRHKMDWRQLARDIEKEHGIE